MEPAPMEISARGAPGPARGWELDERIERLSNAVSLTVLEIDAYAQELVPAFLLANLMSPALWAWREQRRAHGADGRLLSAKSRLDGLQRFFHRYTFTILPGEPGGDAWGLVDFAEEARRFPPGFVERIRAEYDATLRRLRDENPESQFGRIVDEAYYQRGCFPRLKNETLELMNAMAALNPEGKPSGKCIGLGMLWGSALAAWGRFPLDSIVITGNRAHMFVFLDVEDGHLLNNTKWFSTTRIRNGSALSEYARAVSAGSETTFVYNPSVGMCHCVRRTSAIPPERVARLCARMGEFFSTPLKHPGCARLEFIDRRDALPDPMAYESAESYRREVEALAARHPGSVFEHALHAFRSLNVAHPEAYVRAAMREPRAREVGRGLRSVEEALGAVERVGGRTAIFGGRERVAMPDEVLLLGTGSDRDRALLLFTLLAHSGVRDRESVIGLSDEGSFVRWRGRWIDAASPRFVEGEPPGLRRVFGHSGEDAARAGERRR